MTAQGTGTELGGDPAAGPRTGTGPGTGTGPDGAGSNGASTAEGSGAGASDAGSGDAGARPERTVHRLRDLDRRGRTWAALFAVALLLAPILAFAWAAPDWVPSNDPALMAMRALDVGTTRTPLTGQPSTSAHYITAERHVDHPGALHFYAMAIPVRVFGTAIGMLLVSLAIVGSCVLLCAWAAFRQLGRAGGVIAAVALGAITFTTGASTLVNPVSSNMAGYPMLCSMVLLWCLLCGDLRLLPLAAAVVSFTAQQHLSVLPALGVATALGVTLGAAAWGRAGRWRDPAERRELRFWGGMTVAVALVLWAPVLVEQFAPSGGNLTMMVEFARDDDRPTMGPRSAVHQLVNVLGLPPMLGQTELHGGWLLDRPGLLQWVSAGVVVALMAVLAYVWRRNRVRLALVVMAGVVALAGLVNGSSVPEGLEKFRLALYHWAHPLSFLVVVSLGLGLVQLARRTPLPRLRGARPVVAGVALLAVAVPALVNPSLGRRSNELHAAYSPAPRGVVDAAADQVLAHRDELDGEVMLLSRGGHNFDGIPEALAVQLIERGLEVSFPSTFLHYVDDERLAGRETVDTGLMVVVDDGTTEQAPVGERIADESLVEGFDADAYAELLEQAQAADEVRFGPEVVAGLDALPPDLLAQIERDGVEEDLDAARLFNTLPRDAAADLATALQLSTFLEAPGERLLNADILAFLAEHPLESPRLDTELVERLRDALPEDWRNDPLRLSVYRLDRDELLAQAAPSELPD
jgi:hypothetical protein